MFIPTQNQDRPIFFFGDDGELHGDELIAAMQDHIYVWAMEQSPITYVCGTCKQLLPKGFTHYGSDCHGYLAIWPDTFPF